MTDGKENIPASAGAHRCSRGRVGCGGFPYRKDGMSRVCPLRAEGLGLSRWDLGQKEASTLRPSCYVPTHPQNTGHTVRWCAKFSKTRGHSVRAYEKSPTTSRLFPLLQSPKNI